MISVRTIAAQGDVLFRRVPSIPSGAKEQPRTGPLIVAHSETGHHHVIESPDAKLLTTLNPLVCYLSLEAPFADVVHQRPFHTHETLRLVGSEHGPTCFEIRRQREHVPTSEPGMEDWQLFGD